MNNISSRKYVGLVCSAFKNIILHTTSHIFKKWVGYLKPSYSIKVRKKAKVMNRYNQVSHHMGKWQNTWKHHAQVGQEVIPYPAGDHKTARYNKDKRKTQKRSTKEAPTCNDQIEY